MKLKRFGCFCLALLVLYSVMLSVLPNANAVASRRVLAVPKVRQAQSAWCWAACIKSVIQFSQNRSVSQPTIVAALFGGIVNRPATANQIKYTMNQFQLSSTIGRALSMDMIDSNLSGRQPIIGGFIKNKNGHLVVVRGYIATPPDRAVSSTEEYDILYMNPAYGTYEYQSYANLCNPTSPTHWFWNESLYNITNLRLNL